MGNVELTVFVKKTLPHVQGSDKPASFVAATVLMRASTRRAALGRMVPMLGLPGNICCSQVSPLTLISLLWQCYSNLADSPICR
jgi:hypothetical protein